jgi:hypothetical protein
VLGSVRIWWNVGIHRIPTFPHTRRGWKHPRGKRGLNNLEHWAPNPHQPATHQPLSPHQSISILRFETGYRRGNKSCTNQSLSRDTVVQEREASTWSKVMWVSDRPVRVENPRVQSVQDFFFQPKPRRSKRLYWSARTTLIQFAVDPFQPKWINDKQLLPLSQFLSLARISKSSFWPI